MDTVFYPDFLEDISSYQAAADFWQAKLNPLFRELGLNKQDYLNTTMVNGVALNDGNPIYQAYFPELKKAVRIIQEEPLLPADFGSWVNVTEVDEEEVKELVISLVLTEENVERAIAEIHGCLANYTFDEN
jgi:hypothetical protein